MDDLGIAVRGPDAHRTWLLGSLLMFWRALGFKVNGSTGCRGQEAPWIGAAIAIEARTHGSARRYPGVRVSLQPSNYVAGSSGRLVQGQRYGRQISFVEKVAGQLS